MTAHHDVLARSDVRTQRDHIRALLLADRPDLSRRLEIGPRGALMIPLPGRGSIEIGRMRRRNSPRWVVVAPDGDRVQIREPSTLPAVARAALTALAALDGSRSCLPSC